MALSGLVPRRKLDADEEQMDYVKERSEDRVNIHQEGHLDTELVMFGFFSLPVLVCDLHDA